MDRRQFLKKIGVIGPVAFIGASGTGALLAKVLHDKHSVAPKFVLNSPGHQSNGMARAFYFNGKTGEMEPFNMNSLKNPTNVLWLNSVPKSLRNTNKDMDILMRLDNKIEEKLILKHGLKG